MSQTGCEPLFADLPVQPAPTILTCDTHALVRCEACGGSGRIAVDRNCTHCAGGGEKLIPLGGWRHGR